jgi:ankyrin repeat protein
MKKGSAFFVVFVSFVSLWILPVTPALAQAPKGTLASLIESGNRKAALERIRAGADVNEAQPDGTRPIHWAVYKVDYELLAALIAKKANLNARNEFGSTPIAQAAELADSRMVKMLLDAGADPEGPNQDGQTALMLAIKAGEPSLVEMLIKAGANVNTIEKFHNQTPLMWAVSAPKNQADIVKLLLAKGADVKRRALYTDWTSQITSEPRAQYRPVGGLTALLYAARDGCLDCIEPLIAAGADVNIPTPEGVTALMLALDNDHNDVAKFLLDRGANPGLWDWWGRTALYIVVDRKETLGAGGRGAGGGGGGAQARQGAASSNAGRAGAAAAGGRSSRAAVSSMDIINALLAANVDPNPELNFHRPSRGGNSGRFIDPLLNSGCTPLLRATMAGDSEVVRALLAKNANPNINDMGMTAFLVAAGVGPGNVGGTGLAAQSSVGGPINMELMDLLLQHGADINTQITGTMTYTLRVSRAPSANEGWTALHAAAQAGRMDVVRYLLEKGANPQIADAKGRKPIDLVSNGQSASTPPAAAPAVGSGNPASGAEIRGLLEKAASKN